MAVEHGLEARVPRQRQGNQRSVLGDEAVFARPEIGAPADEPPPRFTIEHREAAHADIGLLAFGNQPCLGEICPALPQFDQPRIT